MLKTNLNFFSNVYPLVKSVDNDLEFLSQIRDYSKLKELKNQYRWGENDGKLSNLQQIIINNGNTCPYAKKDPCRGIVKIGMEEKWVLKCVNKSCSKFRKCRPKFDEKEYSLFSPDINTVEGYEYGLNILGEIKYAPKIIDLENFYNIDKEFSLSAKVAQNSKKILEDCKKEKFVNIFNLPESKEIKVELETSVELSNAEIIFLEQGQIVHHKSDKNAQHKHTMETITANIFDLFSTVDQIEIIQADHQDIIFIDAGPGTGKTYTLIEKINYMVCEQHVDPEEIVVLSFTNAAVYEIKKRLDEYVKSGGDRGLRNVDVRTFHSLAWYLLNQANEDEDLEKRGWVKLPLFIDREIDYDSSLKKAIDLLQRFPDFISDWYLMVDEVQDLTGIKADFVIELLRVCLEYCKGISLFGDSCQAIYDYNIETEDQISQTSSMVFYHTVCKLIENKGKFLKLEKNLRQTADLIELTTDFRQAILNQDMLSMKRTVIKLNHEIEQINENILLLTEEELLEFCDGKNVCMLCRNNGQTLELSSTLHKLGIKHTLNAYETKENLAPWIGQMFYKYLRPVIKKDEFLDIAEKKNITFNGYTSNEAWDRLRELIHSKTDIIDVHELLNALAKCKIDDSLFRNTNNMPIIVSNIHRAKGREFESVIIDETFIHDLEKGKSTIGEYKTLYVGLTRPKNKLMSAKFSKKYELKKRQIFATQRKRWTGYNQKKLNRIELDFSVDVNKITFSEDSEIDLSNFSRQIASGDEIKLKRRINVNKVHYEIFHIQNDDEKKLGVINNSLVEDIEALVKPDSAICMPAYIENLYVDSVYTHVETGSLSPKVWNWVDFRGIGILKYDIY